jgi:magnesium chelatase subunit H
VVGRLLEASSRGIWSATPETLERLRQLHDLTDAELEGVSA